jgi:hypothetical protein
MDGYSVTKEINEAVDIAMQVAVQKDKFKSVDDYANQKNLFGIEDDPVSVEIARKLEGTQKEFAGFMQSMNGGLKYAANGEADIFLGEVESREDILARMLNLKKAITNVVDFFRNLRAGKGPRFIKKAVPIQGKNGETGLSERWMQEYIEGIAPYVEEAGISDTGEKVVAVDFDGVINSYISGWKGPTETDAPVLSAAESLQMLYNRGYRIIIFSTRANTQEGIDTIREYLRKHTENNELADTIEITDQKPIADMYIDDRAIPFTGDWEETLKRIEEFKPWTEKSLTWSGYPLQGRTKVHGMDISIENKKGSTRSGTDKDGHEWSIKMNFDYGYIRGTVGVDGDHLDCYVGPNPESKKVFIVNQNDPASGKFDEQKVMLGFDSSEEAKKAYDSQYDRPNFLGDITEMGIDEFKDKIFDDKNKGKMIKALVTEDELRTNVHFLQAVYDFFKDEENPGKIDVFGNRHKMQGLESFPKGLDLENCELLGVEKDKIWFSAGGDWQQAINFSVELKNGKFAITNLFDGGDHKHDRSRVTDWIKNVEMAGEIKKGGSADEN